MSDFTSEWSDRWHPWRRWMARLAWGRIVCRAQDGTPRTQPITTGQDGRRRLGAEPSGAYVRHVYEPEMPTLPRALEAADWARDYDSAAPWGGPPERAWLDGFEGRPCPNDERAAWENGHAAGRSRHAQTYRDYMASCRAVLRKAGWDDEEIP